MNGEILSELGKRIDAVLKRKNLSEVDKTMLEVQQLILVYLKEDHPKVTTMWAWFKPMTFVLIAFTTAFVGALVTGKVSIVFGG